MDLKPTFEENEEPQRRRRRRRRSSSGYAPTSSSKPLMADAEGSVHTAGDEPGDEGDENAPEEHEMEGPAWHGVVFVLVPLLVILLGAGWATWSKALAALLMGAVMLFFPARRKLPRLVLAGLAGGIAAPLLAFLPYSLRGGMPWRESLATDWGIKIPECITPQPWVTLEMWLLLSLYFVWLGWCLSRGYSSAQRRLMLNTLAAGGVLICWLAIMEQIKLVSVPWWPFESDEWAFSFGPFANRTHLSTLAAITCVLCAAAAYDTQRRKSRWWVIYAVGFFIPLSVIFMNSSRAGLLLLFFGMSLWLGTASMRSGFFKKMALTASFILLGAALLFAASGGLAGRVQAEVASDAPISDFRMEVYPETLRISSAAPWIGAGLGNFEQVYSLSVPSINPRYVVTHPESDVLYILLEGGLSTLVPCLLLIYWVLRSTGPWFGKKSKGRSHRHDRRARNTAAIVLLMGLGHGLVDTPNHGLGFFCLMALFAGITLRPRRLPQAAGWPEKTATVVAALAVITLGLAWAAVAFGKPVLPGTSAAIMLRDRARVLAGSGSYADAVSLMDRAITMRPLDYVLYFERARMRLRMDQNAEAALLDFTRARVLNPHFGYICYYEGLDWLSVRPEYAVLGWREFIRRFPAAAPGVHGYYRQMIGHAQPFPELRQQVWSLANTLELKLDFLSTVNTKEDFDLCLRDILARQPDLSGLESAQRADLFALWERLGDHDALVNSIAANKSWEKDGGWKILAEHYAKISDFAKACEIASIYLPTLHRATPGGSTDIKALETAFLFNALDPQLGINLFQAYKNRKDYDSAIKTLDKVRIANNPPTYIDLEIAALYREKEDFRRAWEHYRVAAQK